MEPDVIIAGTDGSRQAECAVEWAAREAAARGANLLIVAVPSPPPRMAWQRAPGYVPDTVAGTVMRSYQDALAAAARRACEIEPGLRVRTALRSGPPAASLCEAGEQASMLVVGSRGGGGFAALVLGSVSRYTATHAQCPVVVVREETTAVHREIVVGIRDLDQPSAIGFAFEEAALRRARLRAVHAWQWFLPEMRLTATERPGASAGDVTSQAGPWLSGLLGFWREKYPEVEVIEDVVHAHPARVLAGLSARADLIVLGRNTCDDSSRPGTNAVTHAVLNHAHGPVAVIAE
ncbi:MAG TPA: universal stress protein [Streptosporangiaceae bacterium]|nr:universal stress protein [Streptosporangiaceae bacterium]